MNTHALIVAGGVGVRMGAQVPKQFLPLAGKPLIFHTLEVFDRSPVIQGITLMLPEEWIAPFEKEHLPRYPLRKLRKVLAGGKTRQDSTWAGLQSLGKDVEVVLVHDGARPLVDLKTIEECARAAWEAGAALAACPANDTVKEADSERRVIRTLDRKTIYLAQTPQAARYSLLQEAFEKARAQGFQGTDEASLLERIGKTVRIVESPATNLKVTTPSDFILAEAILKERGKIE